MNLSLFFAIKPRLIAEKQDVFIITNLAYLFLFSEFFPYGSSLWIGDHADNDEYHFFIELFYHV